MDKKIYRGSYYGIEKTFTVPDKHCFTDEMCLIEVGSLIHYVASQITGLVATSDGFTHVLDEAQLVKIEAGGNYVLVIKKEVPQLVIQNMQTKFNYETGANLIVLIGVG